MKLKSVTALRIAVRLCIALLAASAGGAPWIVRWYAGLRGISPSGSTAILVSYYLCAVPAMVALYAMQRLLRQIAGQHPFDRGNTSYLNAISWCCVAVAAVCAAGGIWYPPLYMVTASMIFLFLTVRVVLSCFKAAAELQEDSDLTV